MVKGLNVTAPPFIPKQQDLPKDTSTSLLIDPKKVRIILNTVTKGTTISLGDALVQTLQAVKTSDECEATKTLLGLFVESATTNYKALLEHGNIPSIGDLCIRVDQELGNRKFAKNFLICLMDHCLKTIRVYLERSKINEDLDEKPFLGPTALISDIATKIEPIREKLIDEVKVLSIRKEKSSVFCALTIYKKIAPNLDEKTRSEIEGNLQRNFSSTSYISAQIEKVLKATYKELESTSSDEEGSETISQQNSTDSENDKKTSDTFSDIYKDQNKEKQTLDICVKSKQQFERKFPTTSIITKLSLILSDVQNSDKETEISDWMIEFRKYIKCLEPQKLMEGNFGRQTATYLVHLAIFIYTRYGKTTLLKELCNICAALYREQMEKTAACENKFRSILINACQVHYDKSYMSLLDNIEKQKVIAVTHFIRGLHEADIIYGMLIVMEVKSLLDKGYINELRLECAVILLRDSYVRLDKSCRSEIAPFYDVLKTYANHCNNHLKEEIEKLIQKKEQDMMNQKTTQSDPTQPRTDHSDPTQLRTERKQKPIFSKIDKRETTKQGTNRQRKTQHK